MEQTKLIVQVGRSWEQYVRGESCGITSYTAIQQIPGYFSGNDNCHLEGKKSSETKMGRMEDPTFATPDRDVHFEIVIYRLWYGLGNVGLHILENEKMVAKTRGLSAKLTS